MQPTRRRPPPPWERGAPAPRHPTGRTHRRFPAAEMADGLPARPPQRYRRAFDGVGDTRVNEGPRLRRKRPSAFDRMRNSPVKHGLMGLAVAGAAAPLAVARYSQMRVDPSHEQQVGIMPRVIPINDVAVGNAWRAELLFLERLDPGVPAGDLPPERARGLWDRTAALMELGAQAGQVVSDPSAPDERWVYKRETCRSCGAPVRTSQVGGRTAYACPVEQGSAA